MKTLLTLIARELSSSGARAIPVPADISDPDMVEEVVESALAQFDRLDIVVNCAGIGMAARASI